MILDKLENAAIYNDISINLKKGFDFLRSTDLLALEPGKYEIDGKVVYALVSEYETKEQQDCRPEAHTTYTDIQFMVSGRESIGFVSLNNQLLQTESKPENDVAFFSCETSPLILNSGMFAVFFPQDVHQPCMQVNGPEKVKKVVVKVML